MRPSWTALLLTLVVLALSAAGAGAQEGPAACANEESHRFDFWPGTWEVESRRLDGTGQWRETRNEWRAETVLGGCAFADYADGDFGTGRIRGMGTRYYDPAADRWYITWMSTRAPGVLQIWEGGFDSAGRGEFFAEITTSDGPLLSRIRWWDIEEDAAEWEHAISRDDGATWQPTWRMSFRRAEAEGATGTTIPHVRVDADTSHSYAIYLPPGHGTHRSWPAILLMDPRGRAHLPLERFREAAGRHGYVLLSSYDTSSDQPTSGPDTRRAVELILNDAVGPLSLDRRRLHLAGFSGTARLAWAMAVQTPEHIAGVAAFGAGALPQAGLAAAMGLSSDFQGVYFGGAGRHDFNYQELRATDRHLDDTDAFHTIRYYAGPHGWPPSEIAAEALEWFELHAQRTGLEPVDTVWVRERLAAAMDRASHLEAGGRSYEAWRVYDRAATGFAGLADASEAEAHRDRLRARRDVRRTLAAVDRWAEWEGEAAERLVRSLEALWEARLPALDQLRRRVRLRDVVRQAGGADSLAAQAAERHLALVVALAGFYRARSFLEADQPRRAVRSLELAHAARPDAPGVCARFRTIPMEDRPADSPLAEACPDEGAIPGETGARRRSSPTTAADTSSSVSQPSSHSAVKVFRARPIRSRRADPAAP